MSAHSPGEYLPLSWPDLPEYEVVYGHVTDADFNEALAAHYGRPEDEPIRAGAPRWRWGRWVLNGQDEYGNPARVLRVQPTPGRGAFRITVCDVRWPR